MSVRSRLERLETRSNCGAWCLSCPPIAVVTEDADGNLLSGAYPPPCARCGGPHNGIRVVVVVEPCEARHEGQP